MQECLVFYRLHPDQVTSIDNEFRAQMNTNIDQFITKLITT